jgi:hypothetical protein
MVNIMGFRGSKGERESVRIEGRIPLPFSKAGLDLIIKEKGFTIKPVGEVTAFGMSFGLGYLIPLSGKEPVFSKKRIEVRVAGGSPFAEINGRLYPFKPGSPAKVQFEGTLIGLILRLKPKIIATGLWGRVGNETIGDLNERLLWDRSIFKSTTLPLKRPLPFERPDWAK